jgi:hypothetical protein
VELVNIQGEKGEQVIGVETAVLLYTIQSAGSKAGGALSVYKRVQISYFGGYGTLQEVLVLSFQPLCLYLPATTSTTDGPSTTPGEFTLHPINS